ncbi:MAG: hypothetical protein QM723_27770 [Myxococcaceae bacterium]
MAEAAMDHLRARGHTGGITFDPVRFRLVIEGAKGMTHFFALKHIFSEYTDAEQTERPRVLQKHLWTLLDAGSAPVDEVLKQVLPRLREPLYFEVLDRQLRAQTDEDEDREGMAVPFKTLNESLCAHLLFDLPTSVVDVNAGRLKAWGLSFDDALGRAMNNLRSRFKEGLKEVATGLWASSFTEGHDAARLLLEELFVALKPKGDLVAMAPASHLLLVADSSEESALGLMGDLAKEALTDVRALSGVAMKRVNGKWAPWLPDSKHPAYERLFFLALQTRANLYAQQKELLDAWHEFIGDNTAVARFSAFRTEHGEIFTSTPWTEGAPALLPHSDRIDFVRNRDGNPEVWAAKWDVAHQVVPHLFEPTNEKPERWRVSGFPTQAELDQLVEKSGLPRP